MKEPVAAAPVKEVDLLGVLDDDFGGTSSLVTEKALPAVNATASLDGMCKPLVFMHARKF